jgi:hypothetical protein
MKKVVFVLKRIFLILGVIVTLMPCGLCSAATGMSHSQMKSCGMGSMSGMKCCQASKSKSQSPLCMSMNHSSVAPAAQGLDLAAVPVVSSASAHIFWLAEAFVSPAFCSFSASPPQGHFSLRI